MFKSPEVAHSLEITGDKTEVFTEKEKLLSQFEQIIVDYSNSHQAEAINNTLEQQIQLLKEYGFRTNIIEYVVELLEDEIHNTTIDSEMNDYKAALQKALGAMIFYTS